jgi:hypothetical protein
MMAVLTMLALAVQSAGLFEVTSIPVEGWDTWFAFADVDGDGDAELCAWRDAAIMVHHIGGQRGPVRISLEEGTQAYDIADLDGDGRSEVIAARGNRVMKYAIPVGGETAEPEDLFALEQPWPGDAERPYAHVMAVEYGGEMVLAVPADEAIELRRLDGAVVERFAGHPVKRVEHDTINVWPNPELCGDPATELSLGLWENVGFDVDLPPELEPPEEEEGHGDWPRSSYHRARDAAEKKPELWPWFPLKKDGSDAVRVLYALSDRTLIRLRTKADELPSRDGPGIAIGPLQAFPGTLLLPEWRPEDLPDFNGDGYVDLVVWTAPQPGMSVDSLTRSALGLDWPIRLFVYLYSPEQNRFEPRPAATLKFKVPVPWLVFHLRSEPFENRVFGDFNGDGKTDCGLSTGEKSFSVWLYDDGFAKVPDESHKFPESINGAWGPSPGRPGEIFLRSEHHIHLLNARQDSAAGE